MPGRALATIAALGVLCEPLCPPVPFTFLTVPQHDARRHRNTAASASLSADGRYLAFASYARLTAADGDSSADIYVLDRLTTTVSLESASADGRPMYGNCTHPRISGDGRYVVFDAVVED